MKKISLILAVFVFGCICFSCDGTGNVNSIIPIKSVEACKVLQLTDSYQIACGDQDPIIVKNGKDGVDSTNPAITIIPIACAPHNEIVMKIDNNGTVQYVSDAVLGEWNELMEIHTDQWYSITYTKEFRIDDTGTTTICQDR
jgi:hypothetical protein